MCVGGEVHVCVWGGGGEVHVCVWGWGGGGWSQLVLLVGTHVCQIVLGLLPMRVDFRVHSDLATHTSSKYYHHWGQG